jgi:hypothetical protein
MSGPFKPDPAPAGDPKHDPRSNIPKSKLKRLIDLAEKEEKSWKNLASTYGKATANGVASEVVTELLEHLGHFTGVGTLLTSGKHAAAVASTQEHMDRLNELKDPSIVFDRCTCEQCHVVLAYAYDQKEAKLYKRLAKAMPIPFGSSLIRLGEAARGAYKKLTKTRGVHRKEMACTLWICAKFGCPVAKAIMEELLGGMPAVIEACSTYFGILKVAEKMRTV